MHDPVRIEAEILRLLSATAPQKSISPSDVARALDPEATDWQALLSPVRRAAARLAGAGRIEILRKGKPVPPAEMRGVIRLRAACPAAPHPLGLSGPSSPGS
jgi:hypothetical protein